MCVLANAERVTSDMYECVCYRTDKFYFCADLSQMPGLSRKSLVYACHMTQNKISDCMNRKELRKKTQHHALNIVYRYIMFPL